MMYFICYGPFNCTLLLQIILEFEINLLHDWFENDFWKASFFPKLQLAVHKPLTSQVFGWLWASFTALKVVGEITRAPIVLPLDYIKILKYGEFMRVTKLNSFTKNIYNGSVHELKWHLSAVSAVKCTWEYTVVSDCQEPILNHEKRLVVWNLKEKKQLKNA